LRKVPHSIDRARSAIGFEPEVSFDASMAAFERWFGSTHQFGGEFWELARRI
jgi:nucleoside-diphosphate-sugar epimerase